MNLKTALRAAILALAILAASPARAQFRLGQSVEDEPRAELKSFVKATLIADTTAIEPGKPFRLGVRFEMEPTWHIYYKEPGKTGLPTEVNWKLPEGFTAGELQWAKPKTFGAGTELESEGYEEEVVLFATVTPPAALKDGEKLELGAELTWLVCKEDGQCIPGDGEVALELPVGKASLSEGAVYIDKYAARVPKAPAAAAFKFGDAKAAGSEERKSALWHLLLAFLGGLILNVMPCVLPVLSIKILSFVRQSGQDNKRIFRLGLFFAAGVAVSFLALATFVVALKAAGNEVGWGFHLQEPRFVIVMCGVLVAFGASMFGVFEIDFPGAALQGAEGLQRKEGPAGAFFNGVLATALATPCTAPMLAPALGFAFTQPAWMTYLFFLTIAAGLSLPYVLLSANPSWLKFLPKPGDWMETFKQAMGFLLLGTVVWLFKSLGAQIGSEGLVWTLAFLTAVGFASWLYGQGADLRATPLRRRISTVVALALLVIGYMLFPERHLRALAAIPPEDPANASPSGAKTIGRIAWQPFSIPLVEKLASEGKTVFVDFTAEWCATCKVNETTVLASERVQQAFIDGKVETLIADYTKSSPEITKILRQFGRAGVPMYLVFPAGRPNEPILLPEVLTPSIVIEAIKPPEKS